MKNAPVAKRSGQPRQGRFTSTMSKRQVHFNAMVGKHKQTVTPRYKLQRLSGGRWVNVKPHGRHDTLAAAMHAQAQACRAHAGENVRIWDTQQHRAMSRYAAFDAIAGKVEYSFIYPLDASATGDYYEDEAGILDKYASEDAQPVEAPSADTDGNILSNLTEGQTPDTAANPDTNLNQGQTPSTTPRKHRRAASPVIAFEVPYVAPRPFPVEFHRAAAERANKTVENRSPFTVLWRSNTGAWLNLITGNHTAVYQDVSEALDVAVITTRERRVTTLVIDAHGRKVGYSITPRGGHDSGGAA